MSLWVLRLTLLLGQFVLSRGVLLILRRMGHTFPRLIITQALAFAVTAFVCAGIAAGARHLSLAATVVPGLIVAGLWFIVDALVLMRRRAKIRDAVYISRMR
jgi:hypothetical protein